MIAPSPVSNTLPLLRTAVGVGTLGVALAVARHGGEALYAAAPGGDTLALPWASWVWAVAHLFGALAAVPLGYLVLSWAHPRRGLWREAAGNPAAAMQAAAHALGAVVVAAASWGGCDGGSLAVSAAFTVLGWLSIALVCAGHRVLTRYRDHEEIAAGNLAAALAAAGLHLAVALLVGRALAGQFLGWHAAITGFAIALLWVLLLWPLRELVLARVILRMPPADMDAAIGGRRDLWLGAAEATGYVVTALCVLW